MQHHAALYLGLHCLPKYPFSGFQEPGAPYSHGTNSSVINIYMLTEDTIKLTINIVTLLSSPSIHIIY